MSSQVPSGTPSSVDTQRALDEARLSLAIDAARESVVRTAPNPRVGCVIYSASGELISVGVTEPPGERHAEICALDAARIAGHEVRGSTAYVTLEPCSHTGRSGPCADALVNAGLRRVVIGALDPNPLVSGRGVKRLLAAGVEVEVGVLSERCERLHAPFFKWISRGEPWVSLKGAMTLDGCLATASGHSKWITGVAARTHVHQLRARVDAIMVGGETARRDRPSLTVRLAEGDDPRPVIVSRHLSIPNDTPCLHERAILFHGADAPQARRDQLNALGVTLIELPYLDSKETKLDLKAALSALAKLEITHLLVEGGGSVHGSLLEAGLADDLHLYIAPRLIGRGKPLFNFASALTIPDGWTLSETQHSQLGEDLYLYGRLVSPKEREELPNAL